MDQTHLSQELLENYLSQKLASSEMYEVEHHILECDFCGEALDGLENRTPTEIQHAFEKIQYSLETRKPKQGWTANLNGNRSLLLGIGFLCLALCLIWLLSLSNQTQAKLAFGQQKASSQKAEPVKEETMTALTEAFTLSPRAIADDEQPAQASKKTSLEETQMQDDRGGSGDSQRISRGNGGGANSGPDEIETPELLKYEAKPDTETQPTELTPSFSQLAVGQVLDAKTKSPLSNVYFRIDNNGKQVISDQEGHYNISLGAEHAIVSILYQGKIMDKLAVDTENQLKVYLDLERKEISNIIYITNANRFK